MTESPERYPQTTPRTNTSTAPAENRDSNALRASVLDAALQLGFGSNNAVANWMFNESIQEEEEDVEGVASPGLTSNSTATSEDLHPTPTTPYSGPFSNVAIQDGNAARPEYPMVKIAPAEVPVTPKTQRKLRKTRKPGDGYDSDGGYMSESGSRKEKEKREKQEKKERKEEEKERKKKKKKDAKRDGAEDEGHATEYESDGGYLSEASKKSKFKTKTKTRSKSKSRPDSPTGYETDSTKSPKKPKSKGSFFRSRSKASKSDVESDADDAPSPPVPPMPALPLPIADRFARAGALSSAGSVGDRSMTPSSAASAPYSAAPSASTPSDSTTSAPSSTSDSFDGDFSRSVTPQADYFSSSPVPSASPGASSPAMFNRTVRFERSPPRSGSAGSGSGASPAAKGAFPAISFPNTNPRSLSPSTPSLAGRPLSPARSAPGVGDLKVKTQLKGPPRPLALSSSPVASPIPSSFVVVTPVSSSAHQPVPDSGILAPASSSSTLAPMFDSSRPDSVIASSEYVVSSPLPSPRSPFAYQDIPPPSPPPVGPLPPPPPPQQRARSPADHPYAAHGNGNAQANGNSYTPAPSPMPGHRPVKMRGREAPFPQRPAHPRANAPVAHPLDGFEARIKIDRYRGLYGFDRSGMDQARSGPAAGYAPAPGIQIEYPSDDEDASSAGHQGIRGDGRSDLGTVLAQRFEAQDARPAESRFREEMETIPSLSDDGLQYADEYYVVGDQFGGSHYYAEADKDSDRRVDMRDEPRARRYDPDDLDLDDASQYPSTEDARSQRRLAPDAQQTVYSAADEDPRISRYSASVYSRNSFLDGEKSQEVRDRFVRRVAANFGPSGREREAPPVPRIPEALADGRF